MTDWPTAAGAVAAGMGNESGRQTDRHPWALVSEVSLARRRGSGVVESQQSWAGAVLAAVTTKVGQEKGGASPRATIDRPSRGRSSAAVSSHLQMAACGATRRTR